MKVKDRNNEKVYETIINNHYIMISKHAIEQAKKDYDIDLLEMIKKDMIEEGDKNE